MTAGDAATLARDVSAIDTRLTAFLADVTLTPPQTTLLTNQQTKVRAVRDAVKKLSLQLGRQEAVDRVAQAQADLTALDAQIAAL